MKPLNSISIFVALLMMHPVSGQDQLKTLSAQQVIKIVREFHPVAKQSAILIEKAKTDITIARGGFDPFFSNGMAQKTFDGLDYYQYNRSEISIPTWFGMEVMAGVENLSGNRTDPQETKGKTSYLGFSIPLARNLLLDKRRAALQTAKILSQASTIEQRNILNNLLLDAMKSYWYWMQYYQDYKILTHAVQVNKERFELVRAGYKLGERPAIDTTEALAQLQYFQVLREDAWLQFQNGGLDLSVFLWLQNDQPFNLPADAFPADESVLLNIPVTPLPDVNELLDAARKNHPELLLYNFKLDALVIDRKLKFQELLPVANFRYNQLGKGYNMIKAAQAPLFANNFQYGFTLGIPLRLSEGRGEYRKSKLRIMETRLEQNLKLAEVENKVKTYFNELVALKNQVGMQEKAYTNYQILQRAEELRFRIGESSLFLINARENKTLEALQKLQELRAKYLITWNALQWAAGLLIE